MKLNVFKYALTMLLAFHAFQATADTTSKDILEEKYILINGIEQWVTIKGESSKPVILFLHGGPGSPLSPYSDAVYGKLEKDFILVQWDQRGSGRTFGRNAPLEFTPEYLKTHPLTVEQITADGIALSEYLVKHLGKRKIILFGTSWGSVVGIKMASQRPGLFTAYVGHSQVVNPLTDFTASYNKVMQLAEKASDRESLVLMREMGAPPYSSAMNMGKMMRVIKKYERINSIAAPESWMVLAPQYDNPEDEKHRGDGDDYSFLNYVGDAKLGVKPMASTINLEKDNINLKIPIYFIQGEADILTSKEVTRAYFDKLKAKKKEYILVANAAHGFNEAIVDAQYKVFKSL